jgi:acyl-coenzyme A synthetase/AMP-(fatty) acid ligase
MQAAATGRTADSTPQVVFSKNPGWERSMEIKFRHDVDNVLEEAKEQTKPVLLDFSAAPM